MKDAYQDPMKPEFALLIKKIFGLPFVHPNDVRTAWMDVKNSVKKYHATLNVLCSPFLFGIYINDL
jgi:hypothetical protein